MKCPTCNLENMIWKHSQWLSTLVKNECNHTKAKSLKSKRDGIQIGDNIIILNGRLIKILTTKKTAEFEV